MPKRDSRHDMFQIFRTYLVRVCDHTHDWGLCRAVGEYLYRLILKVQLEISHKVLCSHFTASKNGLVMIIWWGWIHAKMCKKHFRTLVTVFFGVPLNVIYLHIYTMFKNSRIRRGRRWTWLLLLMEKEQKFLLWSKCLSSDWEYTGSMNIIIPLTMPSTFTEHFEQQLFYDFWKFASKNKFFT